MVRYNTKRITDKQRRIQNIMERFEKGVLKNSSGEIIRNRRKALAMALDEAGVRKSKRRRRQV